MQWFPIWEVWILFNCMIVSTNADVDCLVVYQDIPKLSNLMSLHGLQFLHINVSSLLLKVVEIRLLFHYKDIDFFSITESHLSFHISDDKITRLYYLLFGSSRSNY